MKGSSEGGFNNNGAYVWNKLDTDVADSYSPPILESSDVPNLQRNRVSRDRDFFYIIFYDVLDNASILKFLISLLAGVRRAASRVHR